MHTRTSVIDNQGRQAENEDVVALSYVSSVHFQVSYPPSKVAVDVLCLQVENEDVVASVLATHGDTFALSKAMPKWTRRGIDGAVDGGACMLYEQGGSSVMPEGSCRGIDRVVFWSVELCT